MELCPVGVVHSPFKEKFGTPRQPGLLPHIKSTIIFSKEIRLEALNQLEGFDYIWLIFHFHQMTSSKEVPQTVRPPRLGGNKRVGVFASRAPNRPNNLGLSVVKRGEFFQKSGLVHLDIWGADVVDQTPIFDIKPYIPSYDSIPHAAEGWTQKAQEKAYPIEISEDLALKVAPEELEEIKEILAKDPRPRYKKDDADKIYGLFFGRYNIRFQFVGHQIVIIDIDLVNGTV